MTLFCMEPVVDFGNGIKDSKMSVTDYFSFDMSLRTVNRVCNESLTSRTNHWPGS